MNRKRSMGVVLTLGSVLLAGCGRRNPDPCEPESFDARGCEDAVSRGGYYNRGVFVPHVYPFLYPYYFGRYGSYRSGTPMPAAPPPVVTPAAPAPSGSSAGSVARGGFGSTAHGASGGGSGE